MSRFKSNKQFNGTAAERALLKTANIRPGDEFLESDTGSVYEWSGAQWINIRLFGSNNIHDADVHTQIVNQYLHQHTAVSTTLASASAASDYQIDIADATGFAVGDYLHIDTTTIETTHPVIISSSPALPTTGPVTLTLDRRLDKAHAIGDEVRKSIVNMALAGQVGTLASPQEYWIGPPAGEIWHLTRILFEMTHSTAGDLGLFGNLAALTNGTVLRARNNGAYGTLTNWKTNANIKTDMFDVVFDARSGGGGAFGTTGRGTFTNAGAILRLDGDTDDRLEVYIQDDITAMVSFTMKGQGHVEVG